MEILNVKTPTELLKVAKLITNISKAGLDISDLIQIGVNQNSRNVFIWSEDWVGCAFIGLGDPKVYWEYTCMECGETKIFSTYKQMEKFVNTQNSKGDGFCPKCRN